MDSSPDDQESADAFGQGIILPPLIIQLRKILDQYPDDSQIFKELVQNAEDAGAREVKLLYDRKTYGTMGRYLHHPGMAKYQGPALYAYNDATFNDDDWRGIRMLSQSVKQNDPLKVGYFGMGFKSVFHFTDLPFIVSGDHAGVIEPHQEFFPSSSHGWTLSKDNLLELLPHQFEPFSGIFTCTRDTFKDGYFPGTLFRFPLRTKPSALSDVIYNNDKVQALLDAFQEDAHLLLLFLRHVESVEVHTKDAHTLTPKLLFRVELSEDCREDVRQKRQDFVARATAPRRDGPVMMSYPVTVVCTCVTGRDQIQRSYTWLVTNYFVGGQTSATFRKLQMDPDLHYPPWVGAAMPLSSPEDGQASVRGHIFCALPLPSDQSMDTGLPVEINGYFSLEQNRKHIKWPTSYRTREDMMDKRLLWNQCMLKEALPKAYASLLRAAIQLHRQGSLPALTLDSIYAAFPDLTKVDRKWDSILPTMYSDLFKDPVVFTEANGGNWIHAKEAVFDTLDAGDAAREAILEVLASADVKVAAVPMHVQEAVRVCCMMVLGKMTPQIVSKAYKDVQFSNTVHWEKKLQLLRYFLKLTRYDLLDGLELLPMANGGFSCIYANPRKAEHHVYIACSKEVQELFPGMEDDFVDHELDADLQEMLQQASKRGYTQIKVVDNSVLGDLLREAVPKDWMQGQVVTWAPGSPGQPPHSWLTSLWLYLVNHQSRDLSCVERLPCVPVGKFSPETENIQLLPLVSDKVLMMQQMDGLCLGEGLEDILGEMGIYVIADLPDFIKLHPLVSRKYVYSPSYIGVIQALEQLCEINGDGFATKCLQTLEDEDRRTLRRLFAKVSEYEMSSKHRHILERLPLFETVEGSGGQSSRFVPFVEVSLTAPAEELPVHVSRPLLALRDTHSVNLARVLGVKELTVAELLMEHIFPDIENMTYENEDVEKLMIYVLKQFHSFQSQGEQFKATLRVLPFLPRKDMLLTPDRFYDPDNELLQEMFFDEDNFPSGSYAEPSIVAILGEIGLRGVHDVEPEDLLESACCITDLINNESDQKAVISKADAIMNYLVKHPHILEHDCQGTPLREALKEVVWVRRMDTMPTFYPKCLSWFEGDLFCKPAAMVCRKYAHLVGSVMPTLALDVPESMQTAFQWSSPPDLQFIVRHLKNVISAFDGKEKAAFAETMDSVYTVLSKHDIEDVKAALKVVTEWVWHGEGFACPQNVFFQEAFMDLRPYVYCIPWELRQHHGLFIDLGVMDKCPLPDVLTMIRDRNLQEEVSAEKVKRDLHLSVSILNELKSHITEDMLNEYQDRLWLPVHDVSGTALKMAALLDCTYSDMEWIRQGYDINDFQEGSERQFYLVHPNVPVSTSEALGVPTLMSRMLDAEELDFSFGQADSLTHRLNVLLQEYTDGFAVPKELVQNADDAGATEVKFLYDERQNEDCMTCLIDEGMRECQGPALWAYNNAAFSDEDFENITKLSGATKENQTDKIGRFGLGFNAVYNITDVPSFVSRHNIVIFDPHTTHLGKSIKNKAKPGIKIDMRKHRRKLRRLGNQFKPYNDVFGCDLRPDSRQEDFGGTLFRFPLRTRQQAILSEISQKHYDDHEVRILLKMLAQGAENLLLFTQNVTKISVYHLSPKASSALEMGELFSVEKSPVRYIRDLVPNVPLSPSAADLSPEMKELIRSCSTLKASTACMRELRHGANIQNMQIPDSSLVFDLTTFISTEGEVLLDEGTTHHARSWLVTCVMGHGEVLRMALQEENLLPTAGVAIPLKKIFEGVYEPCPILASDGKHNGTIFTYLPLPVHSGLPVHINAPFAVTASRRHLCEKTEDDKFDLRAIWNHALMTEPVCLAYVRLLMDLSLLTPETTYKCHDLWPHLEFTETACLPVLHTFYELIAQSGGEDPMNVFSDGKKWGSIHDAHFIEAEYAESEIGSVALQTFRQCTSESSDLVVDLPLWSIACFEEAGVSDLIQEQTFSRDKFFEQVLLPNVLEVDQDCRDRLILDALEREDQTILNVIQHQPCIPVTPHGHELKKPSELVHPKSKVASLFYAGDGRFPYNSAHFASTHCLRVLSDLGMASDVLSWEDVLERAESIQRIEYDEAKQRIPALLNYINNKLMQEGDDNDQALEAKEKLLTLTFLPVMFRPPWFPVAWKSDDLGSADFFKPSEVYLPEQSDLVCCVSLVADPSIFPADSDHLKSFLGMKNTEPEVELVLSQLDILTTREVVDALGDPAVYRETRTMCHSIYSFLQDKCHSKRSQRLITERLQDKRFLLWKDRFLSPGMLALEFPYSCAPYLQGLPEDMKNNFDTLLNAVGVREHFQTPDFVLALQHMHDDYPGEVMSKDLLKLALQVVNLLNDSMEENDQTLAQVVEEYGTIYIPDANKVLQSASGLCFNEPEFQWLPTNQQTSYSHPLIPFTISKQLGVNTKRQEVLKKHSRGIPFGQREKLTNRLKRILSSYPCDKEILKEMLQNADDSGATEIQFIKDPRQHGRDRVFEDSWKPLQGPGLCVFNNRPFSESDIEGIQRLGEGSKGSDPNKTGQYGVGFNCVYHLTDAPSFLTRSADIGETLCVFDPHGAFVPGASSEEPGRRYDEVSELRGIFTDVFPCYLEDKFALDEATMFRFPLRNEEMAAKSELSEQVIGLEVIDVLFSKFKAEAFDCLLFLNNVDSLTLCEVDSFTKRLTGTYKVTVQVERGEEEKKRFSEQVKKIAGQVKSGRLSVWDIPVHEVTYSLNIADNQGKWEKWLVSQQIGFSGSYKPPQVLIDAFRHGDLALLPRGGVAALVDSSDLGSTRQKRAFCFLPLPVKTDLPVHINGHFALESEARRNIWMDNDSGPKADWNTLLMQGVIAPCYVSLLHHIPDFLSSVHISSNISMMEMTGENVPNVDLYGDLFPKFNKGLDPWSPLTMAVYQHIHESQIPLLPIARPSNSFCSVSRSSLALDSIDGLKDQAEIEWLPTKGTGGCRPYFDNLDCYIGDTDDLAFTNVSTRRKHATSTPKRLKPSKATLRQVLVSSGFKLIKLPLEVFESFQAAGVEVDCISPAIVVEFYKSYDSSDQLCTIGSLPCDICDTPFTNAATLQILLQYCAQESYYLMSNLAGLPLLLTEDNQLRQFSTADPVFLTPYHDLLPGLNTIFIHHTLVRSVFKEVDMETCDVFKHFDLPSFAALLSNVLSAATYKSGRQHVEWPQDSNALPNPQWIWMLWTFIQQEYERVQVEQPDADENTLFNLLKPLKDWSILPAVVHKKKAAKSQSLNEGSDSEHYLVPLQVASTVIDYSQVSIMSYGARECLRKMKIPELNCRMLDGGQSNPVAKSGAAANSSLAKMLVATLEKPKSVLFALQLACTVLANQNLSLRSEDCYLICKYYSDAAASWANDYDTHVILRKLPLFVTMQGSLSKLGKNEVFTLSNEIPKTDMTPWEANERCMFLVHQAGLEDLYDALNITILSLADGYTQHIFKHFEYLSQEAQEEHLKFIKDSKLPHMPEEERSKLIEGLRSLEFLKDDDGFIRTASEYYDPYHAVFKVMMAQNSGSFPPAPYCEFKWLDFMRTIGLQHNVSVELFVHFAREIACEAETSASDATFNKARTLATNLFKMQNLPNINLLESIVDIKFIPAAKVNATLQKIFPRYACTNGDRAYISFKEGIPENHEVLVWSCSHLLPDWANPFLLTASDVSFSYPDEPELNNLQSYQKRIAEILQVTENPGIDLVIRHIENVCAAPLAKNAQLDELQSFMKVDVMKRVYRHLQSRVENNPSDQTIEQMKVIGEIPCIVIDMGKTFVKPKQVVINLYEEDQIIPYLFKAPTELGEFKTLFTHLGASTNVTADQYAAVLESLFNETAGEKLHPNELRLSFKAVAGLFKILQRKNDEPIQVPLYLPSSLGKLVPSCDLVYNDDPSYQERIQHFHRQFLVHLSECHLKAANFMDLIRLIPHDLRPAMLTQVVQEHLEEKSRERLAVHGLAEKLRYQLNSKAFSHGIMRLLRHEHRKSGHKIKVSVLQTLQQQLKRINVYGADHLVTFLTYEGQKIEGSESESQCFAERRIEEEEAGEDAWTICVNSSIGLTEELLVSVAEVVNRIIGDILSQSVHYIQPILTCAPHSISRVLDKMKIRPDHSMDMHQTTLPPPGSFIPIEDHHLLKEDFEDFEQGEYVGYELDDDETGGRIIIYATVMAKIPLPKGADPQDDHLAKMFRQQYKINVSEDRDTLACVTDLYKFHRVEGFVMRGDRKSTSASTPRYRESFYERSSVFEPQSPKSKKGSSTGDSASDAARVDNGRFPPQEGPLKEEEFDPNAEFDQFTSYQDRYFKGDGEIPEEAEQLPEGEGMEMQQYNGREMPKSEQANGHMDEETSKQSIMMEEISDQLEDAWHLPSGEKKKVIKRLLLKWHPDKNIGEEEMATVITQHIHSELERLELGLPRPEKFEDLTTKYAFDPRNPFAGNENFKKNFYNAYQYFFEQMNRRAKEHKEQRQRYKENLNREYNSERQGDFSFDVPPTFSSSNPQPAQAKRFLRQAQEDLRATDNDYETKEPAFEWVCFKAHQAAEKAFKAAQFSVDAVTSFSHDLVTLAASVEDMELRRLAQRLQGIVGNSSKLYNPDPIDFVVIPHEEYTREMACDAVMCAADILERVKEFLDTRE
ncbi:hypothetical protein CAPTEDRAFT_195081 [Capitella teleta]|uniref:HEPN domain-containing protein n=1 Tax=Capitella teleta TaxID=283909 RepID=R7TYR4_CAPTE|nr:hypothetical protein CAPTEDRAFT_195081 [Capitella teleta]|eukprot:ELT96105.1 hypothetical protein CAPTEDRAFT_195081 [Capitella teleta]